MNILGFVLIALIIMVIIFAKMSIVIISQSETKVVERLGKYYATLRPGINIIIPDANKASIWVVASTLMSKPKLNAKNT